MKYRGLLLLTVAGLAPSTGLANSHSCHTSSCSADAINISPIFGLEIVSIEANAVYNASINLDGALQNSFSATGNATGVSYCNVTVTTQRPGYADNSIKTGIILPLYSSDWNERMLGVGGGGFVAGNIPPRVIGPLAYGWATVSTSAGVSRNTMADHTIEGQNSDHWALRSTGNVDLEALADFGYRSLGDAAVIGKQVIESFYGRPPLYRYWNGCSTGGRQALMLAQRYPDAYHGLLGSCPAINWARFLSADIVPQIVLKDLAGEQIPPPSEFAAITAAALEVCDELDGVRDGYVLDPSKCEFKASSVLDQVIPCPDIPRGMATISEAAVKAAEVAWAGYQTHASDRRYYGVSRTTNITGRGSLLDTTCDEEGTCALAPFGIALNWVKNFLMKDLDADPMNLTLSQFDRLWQLSVQEWSSFMSTDDPDLRAFKATGGKLLSWHGLDDIQIQSGGTEEYYNRVLAIDPDAADYFRYFEAPGIGHCSGGFGSYPGDAMQSLMDWVEQGEPPKTLYGRTPAGVERRLCLYPKKIVYDGEGDPTAESSFSCV